MKRLLVLSNVYPAPDIPKGYTPVVHYFTREWVKLGYDVKVINYDVNFPAIYYTLSRPFNDIISSQLGCEIKKMATRDLFYSIDNVPIKRISVKKIIPHGLCPNREIEKALQKSVDYLQEEQFVPDVIIAHWANPCLQIMSIMKERFNAFTCFVTHGVNELNVFGKQTKELLNKIDIVGCRSEFIRKCFIRDYGDKVSTFNCYSGIPEKYISLTIKKNISKISNFIYVGTLISRKFPSKIIPALTKAYAETPFSLHYIGEGNEKTNIEKLAQKLSVSDKIHLHGRLQRDKVVEMLDKSDVFIMISKDEAFGLVYLEAMARGCITIASKREGFDGIIQDGVNGFLCEAGDSSELSSIITKIRNMSIENLQNISDNAIKTAFNFTDVKSAKRYINVIEQEYKKLYS